MRILAVLFVLLAASIVGQATTLVRMNLDDLTTQSQTVVHATIAASRTEWSDDHKVILTIYTVEPLEYLKGRLGTSFELRELGGEKDGLLMTVPSVPVFSVGQEEVLFVWTDPQGRHQAIGFEQGALDVHTDPVTGQKTVDRALLLGSAQASPSGSAAPASKLLPELFSQIRASIAKAVQAGAGKESAQ